MSGRHRSGLPRLVVIPSPLEPSARGGTVNFRDLAVLHSIRRITPEPKKRRKAFLYLRNPPARRSRAIEFHMLGARRRLMVPTACPPMSISQANSPSFLAPSSGAPPLDSSSANGS